MVRRQLPTEVLEVVFDYLDNGLERKERRILKAACWLAQLFLEKDVHSCRLQLSSDLETSS
jgi:hypothetical protein